MECPLCGFENLPGTKQCTRCRAQLVASAPASLAEVTPPRAGRLRAFRGLAYALNRVVDRLPPRPASWLGKLFDAEHLMPGEALAAMILSVIPGAGHLAMGRRRAALIAFGGWAFLAFLTINFYAGATGGLLIGTLASWHACVVFDVGRLQQYTVSLDDRLIAMLFIMCLVGVAYYGAHSVAAGYVDIVGSPFAFERLGIQEGDTLLAWRRRCTAEDIAIGDLVTVEMPRGAYYQSYSHGYVYRYEGGTSVGVVIAKAGDKVAISPAGIEVNGALLAPDALPAGRLLMPTEPVSFTVPENRLVIPHYIVHDQLAHAAVNGHAWKGMCVHDVRALRGRVAMVYLPWTRRHALRR